MTAITLNLAEAMLRLGGRGQVVPQLIDTLVPVLNFGDVSALVPVPSAARGLASRQLAPGGGQRATFILRWGSDAVVEQLLLSSTAAWTVGVWPTAFTPNAAILQLGGPAVVSEFELVNTAATVVSVVSELPPSVALSGLEWRFQRASTIAFQCQTPGTAAGFGCVFREYQTIPGPE